MKKLFCAMILALVLLLSASALGEEIVLPDPGHYFGRSYDGDIIEFDTYPKAEFDAYTYLLMDKYGLEITHDSKGEYGEYYIMEMPGIDDSRVIVTCYAPSSNSDGYGLQLYFGSSYVLHELDTYEYRYESSASGEVAWDDGRMIADPGDFLGYDIQCTERADDTGASTKGYFKYRYEAIPVADILSYADALKESPYFRYTGSLDSDWYRLLYFSYIGMDADLIEKCDQGRAEIGDYFRKGDLCIYIYDPYVEKSEFAIYEYPGFTVNSQIKEEIYDGDGCSYCHGDGKCNECGGTSWVWVTDWEFNSDGLPELVTNNEFCSAIYCNGGICTECGGSGRK